MGFIWRRFRNPSLHVKASRHLAAKPRLEVLEWRTAPAVFTVNTTDDTIEAARDGSGLDGSGNISLRSAIMAVNDLGGENTVIVPAGTYQLTIAPGNSDGDDSGDLTVGNGVEQINLSIEGAGSDSTIIDANYLDRGFDIGFFTTVSISGLAVMNAQGTFGGAIYNAGHLTLNNDLLTNNSATFGGGIFGNGPVTILTSTLAGNVADQGGAILNSGTMTIADTTVEGNFGSGQGGGIFNNSMLTLTGSTIAGNSTPDPFGRGGGIFNQSSMALTNDTIANNTASQGGGIDVVGFGTSVFTNVTIAGNIATGTSGGGGLFVESGGSPTVQMKNTLIALNNAAMGADVHGVVVSMGHNLIGDGTGGSGFVESDFVGTTDNPIDPTLGPLQDNGGPTQTMALQEGSLAIANGDPDGAPLTDQRGVARGDHVDIGAFQFDNG